MDIDDTLTTRGKLVPEAFTALASLRAAGLVVIPVTGRPAGWCDLIARQWPVDAVIGENGAFAFYERDGSLHRLVHPSVRDDPPRTRLDAVRAEILDSVPGARVSKDQAYRLYDLAIDFCEEPPNLGLESAEQIREIFEAHGACAKISSIHVNGWFGDYDKLAMTRQLAHELFTVDADTLRDTFVFVGDSPNDAPMFDFFTRSIGVANVRRFSDRISHPPKYVSKREGGEGFSEIAGVILAQHPRERDGSLG